MQIKYILKKFVIFLKCMSKKQFMKFNWISNYKIYHLRINDQIFDNLEKYKKKHL